MGIQGKLNLADLRAIQKPTAQASGLPNVSYTDEEIFSWERDKIIGATWVGLEFESSLPEPGFALPLDFMGLPLFITRDKHDQYRVFHNICSHRGMILVNEPGLIKNLLRCPYHSWSYELNGKLKSTPHIGGVGEHQVDGFQCADKGLKQIPSANWMGMIFINLSASAQPFADFIAPLESRWSAFVDPQMLHQAVPANDYARLDLQIESNWKFAIENYCEAYHLPWVHPDLNSYSPLDQHENLRVNDYMSGQASHNYKQSEVNGTRLPVFDGWPGERLKYGEYISLYPNVLLGLQVDHFFAIILQPRAPDKTRERLQISVINETANTKALKACRKAVMDAWEVVFKEDIFAVEGMQKGRQSPGFNGGHFSPVLDTPSHDFHKWVANRYQQALTP